MATARKSRGTYVRERVRITADHTRKAASLIAAGKVEGRGLEYADVGCPGLVLRVTPLSGAWLLKTERTTVRLGDMDALPVAAAREAATRSRLAMKDGRHPGEDLRMFGQALQRTDDVALAAEAAFPDEVHTPTDAHRRRHGPWTWEDLVEEFLAVQLPKKKASWATQFERHLRYQGFEAIRFTPLCELDVEALEKVRDAITDEVAISSVARAVNETKAALDWAWRYKRRQSRLGAVAWWESFDIEYASGTRDHVPTLAELGRTLALAERHRALGSTGQETTPGTLAALWATVLTAQRTGALGGTRLDRIIPMPDRPDWQVWTWSGDTMKGGKSGGRPHALPIPPAAIEVLARFEDPDVDSPYVFPSRMDGRHVTSEGIAGLLDRLQGKSKPSRAPKPGKPARALTPRTDLFRKHRIRPWVPHDARRALGTFLDDEDLGGAASAILAHKTGKRDDEHARLEDVTRKVYAKAQRLELKARGMELWVTAVIAAYEREVAALQKS
ncbi:integrase arm-type DNA-binding domain-containing protein [Methylobacterium sp. D48H]